MSEQELITRACGGDFEAFMELVTVHQGKEIGIFSDEDDEAENGAEGPN